VDQARTDKELDGVASVEKFAMEEGTEPFTRVEHTRYDGGERDNEDSLFRLFSPLCDACALLTSFEEIGEGPQGVRGGTCLHRSQPAFRAL